MQKLFNILGKNRNYKTFFKDKDIETYLKKNWTHIIGPLVKDLVLSHVKHHVVYIAVENQMWVTEAAFYKDQFIEKMNINLKKNQQIKDIVIKKDVVKFKEVKTRKTSEKSQLKDLEAKIISDVKEKKKRGELLCVVCREVYTDQKICTFCRVEEQYRR